jgi:hypothetical protein
MNDVIEKVTLAIIVIFLVVVLILKDIEIKELRKNIDLKELKN